MSDDDRPRRTKSWRELDAAKDRGGRREQPSESDRRHAKTEKSTAYKSYKSNLDKLFTPGGAELPESLRAKLGAVDTESKEKQDALRALREAPTAETLGRVIDLGLELPDDPRVLMQLFDVADEQLLVRVLTALLAIIEGGKKPSRMLLLQKVDALKLKRGSGAAVDLASQIRAALG